MPPKKRGRPRERPIEREEAKRQAEKLFDDFKNNRLDITEGALRRKINLLGEVPNTGGNERWFSYSNRKGTPKIVDYERSTPRVQEAKSSVAEDIKRQQDQDKMKKQKQEDRLKDQVDFEKIQEQTRQTEDRAKRREDRSAKKKEKEKTQELEVKIPEPPEFDWSQIVFDPAEPEMVDFKEEKKVEMKKNRREEDYLTKPPRPKRVRKSPEKRITPEVDDVENEEIFVPVIKGITQEVDDLEYDLDYKHDVGLPYGYDLGLPYVNELIDGQVEKIPNVEDLNQNIVGINEREGRRVAFKEDQDLFRQAERFLREDRQERGLEIEEDKYEPLLIPDIASRNSREVSNAGEYLSSRYGETKAQERMNLIPELKEASKQLLTDTIENKMQELGMNVPEEIKRMGNETLSGIIKDANIGLSLEDIEGMIGQAGVPINELREQLPTSIAQRLPELKSVGRKIAQRLPELKDSGIPKGVSNTISSGLDLVNGALSIVDRLPESMTKKIKEAGGNSKDISQIEQKTDADREQKTDADREQKTDTDRERKGITPWVDDIENEEIFVPVRKTAKPEEGGDPEQLLLEQINMINRRLGDVGSSSSMSYPEQRKIKPYRFPKPNEYYDAVELIQNRTIGFLNDLNLYGNVGDFEDI